MKYILSILFFSCSVSAMAQNRVNPVVKNFGGIFEIPYAEEKPDPTLDYKIIVEVVSNTEKYDSIN